MQARAIMAKTWLNRIDELAIEHPDAEALRCGLIARLPGKARLAMDRRGQGAVGLHP
jgi:hypothetical protein